MKARLTRISITPALIRAEPEATRQGLIAAGNILRNFVRRELAGGYSTSLGNRGHFVTGNSLAHVTLGDPDPIKGKIAVGTDLLHNLFWEVGHHNIFTRHFEQDEKWRPAAVNAARPAAAAFTRVFQRVMRSAADSSAGGRSV